MSWHELCGLWLCAPHGNCKGGVWWGDATIHQQPRAVAGSASCRWRAKKTPGRLNVPGASVEMHSRRGIGVSVRKLAAVGEEANMGVFAAVGGVCKNYSRSRLGGAADDTEQSKRMRLGMTAVVMDVMDLAWTSGANLESR
jgi:hypothetical protein